MEDDSIPVGVRERGGGKRLGNRWKHMASSSLLPERSLNLFLITTYLIRLQRCCHCRLSAQCLYSFGRIRAELSGRLNDIEKVVDCLKKGEKEGMCT